MLPRFPFLALLLAFVAPSAAAATPQVLQAFSAGLEGLDGRFVQRVFDADEQMTEETQGRVALSAPRQFRWEYEEPFPQLIVADGERVFIYDPDLEQVTVRRQSDEEQSSPLAALIEPGALERQFEIEFEQPRDGTEWVRLTPRGEETAFTVAELGLRDGELLEMHMTDSLGQRTEILFSDWQRNPPFPTSTFRFVPPPGVDVVGAVEPGAEVYPIHE